MHLQRPLVVSFGFTALFTEEEQAIHISENSGSILGFSPHVKMSLDKITESKIGPIEVLSMLMFVCVPDESSQVISFIYTALITKLFQNTLCKK